MLRTRFTLCLPTALALALLSACGGGGGISSGSTPPPAPALTALAVTPASPRILVNGTEPFIATGSYADGTAKNLTASVTWSSGTPATATLTAGGLATGISGGTSVITASLGSIKGSTVLSVDAAPPAPLVSLNVNPASLTLAKSATRQFAATGSYSDGTSMDLTAYVIWTSGTPEVASINGAGLVTGLAGGSSVITATLNAITGSGTVTVTVPTLVALAVTPTQAVVSQGGSYKFTATGTFSDGTNALVAADWGSADTTIATVDGTGLVTGGTTYGSTTITANLGGFTGTATIINDWPVPTKLVITPASPSVVIGSTTKLTASVTWSDGHVTDQSGPSNWSTSSSAIASIKGAGLITGVAPGTATITATFNSQSNTSGTTIVTASVTLNVISSPLTGLIVTPASGTLNIGDILMLTATGTYGDGHSADLTIASDWTSSNTAVATVAMNGGVAAHAAGTATITATVGAITGTTTLTVTASTGTFDSRLLGNWKWLGFPDTDGNSYGSFYVFNANGTFTYDLIYLGSGINCLAYSKVVAHHQGTFTSLGSLSDPTNAGKIVFNCTGHETDYTSCSGSVTPVGWGGSNPHFHWAAFSGGNLLSNHADDFYPTGNLVHSKY